MRRPSPAPVRGAALAAVALLAACTGVSVPPEARVADRNACLSLACDDGLPCTSDGCDRVQGACTHTPAADGLACADATACHAASACAAGACLPGKALPCDDGNVCTDDGCDVAKGGCTALAGAPRACGAAKACEAPPVCAAGACKTQPLSDGEACGDATPCTAAPVCAAGACAAAKPLACADDNPCTADSCDAAKGCQSVAVANMKACQAGGQVCWQGACVGAPPQMIALPASTFWMGCVPGDGQCQPHESPRHSVQLSAFYLDTREVTVEQYGVCVNAGVCTPPDAVCSADARGNWAKADRQSHPVNCVSAVQAAAYCAWRLPGGALPSEAQFEWALRAGQDGHIYPTVGALPPPTGSANLPDQAALTRHPEWDVLAEYADGYAHTAPVGTFSPNALGLYDVWGNVWEWTRDWVDPAGYPTAQVSDPVGPASGSHRPVRGSGFYWLDSGNRALRASYRLITLGPTFLNNDLGFRCAHDG